jgi:hypothetical protein
MIPHINNVGPMTAYQHQNTNSFVKNTTPDPKKAPASDTLNEPAASASTYTRDQTRYIPQIRIGIPRQISVRWKILSSQGTSGFRLKITRWPFLVPQVSI